MHRRQFANGQLECGGSITDPRHQPDSGRPRPLSALLAESQVAASSRVERLQMPTAATGPCSPDNLNGFWGCLFYDDPPDEGWPGATQKMAQPVL